MICCGEERDSNYCPTCGKAIPKVGIAELAHYIKKRIQQESKRLDEWGTRLNSPDLTEAERKDSNENYSVIQSSVSLWKSRLQAVEDLIAAAKEVEAKAARRAKARPEAVEAVAE